MITDPVKWIEEKPTGNLRWFLRHIRSPQHWRGPDMVEAETVLQQQWSLTTYSGPKKVDIALEWRDVPTVTSEAAAS